MPLCIYSSTSVFIKAPSGPYAVLFHSYLYFLFFLPDSGLGVAVTHPCLVLPDTITMSARTVFPSILPDKEPMRASFCWTHLHTLWCHCRAWALVTSAGVWVRQPQDELNPGSCCRNLALALVWHRPCCLGKEVWDTMRDEWCLCSEWRVLELLRWTVHLYLEPWPRTNYRGLIPWSDTPSKILTMITLH